MICYLLAVGKQHLGPHVIVGYGIKIFSPGLFISSPDHLVFMHEGHFMQVRSQGFFPFSPSQGKGPGNEFACTSCCVMRRNFKLSRAVRSCYGKFFEVIGLHDPGVICMSLRRVLILCNLPCISALFWLTSIAR